LKGNLKQPLSLLARHVETKETHLEVSSNEKKKIMGFEKLAALEPYLLGHTDK
jgi:hypothetical protein